MQGTSATILGNSILETFDLDLRCRRIGLRAALQHLDLETHLRTVRFDQRCARRIGSRLSSGGAGVRRGVLPCIGLQGPHIGRERFRDRATLGGIGRMLWRDALLQPLRQFVAIARTAADEDQAGADQDHVRENGVRDGSHGRHILANCAQRERAFLACLRANRRRYVA